jgi:hypothetical protein
MTMATAVEAVRVSAESARLVSTIGTRAPSTMPEVSASARYSSCLASMLPDSMSGTSRMSAWPATADLMPLVRAATTRNGVVEGQRAVEQAAGDLAAVGHLAQRGGVERGLHLELTVSTAARIATLGSAMLQHVRQVDGVLHDVDLGFEVGRDVDRGVGDEQQARVGRHVHQEDVADAARGAQAGGLVDDFAHQFVGVQRALHQRLDLAFARQRDGDSAAAWLCGDVDQGAAVEVELVASAIWRIFLLGADQGGDDQAAVARQQRTLAAIRYRRGGPRPSTPASGRG